ncbi:MAG: hypothetical protein UX02_C0002G0320 [Candidatus Moranbacteria bacterium GW2011_GWC1_45_18]|nr:MAG: hypothetical protein UT79_C0001G0141 [Candidatus Moranbacteria bacterium GW2011_GWC2_40_12]KKT33723.1 MAG: hypothetical protein UW19_C0006G0025 [Candidatus Moranbacteria bacterium GW2011_GWF2_44_10]KKU00077.1 MAG: hypothetical protein UX02_C0002G0320 [Candidatus Moranbacteria bacterium GW2011_GWC1_45_18]OGI22287.1 MAG: hypothetical protein A2194_00445 [Candidatus Moranbacteria bacterium RIFOXYA1_FULL_44_8]OGI34448.1 MAG: hypothetical protein A2407_04120 [Candidatus Moranbacteria bacteri
MKKKDKKNKTHTLIISDFHLGSRVSRSKEAAELLNNFQFKKLILLGDIFEDLNFNRLSDDDWNLISVISKLSKTTKVRWVEGNHDKGLANIFSALTGARLHRVYRWQHNNRKYLAIHGHQFDNFLIDNAFLSILASQLYNLVQLFDFKDKRISHFLKSKSKGWLRLSEKVASRAILYAKLRGVNYIFCGHTHKAMFEKRGNIRYYNSGCWTDVPSTYITLDGNRIKINEY